MKMNSRKIQLTNDYIHSLLPEKNRYRVYDKIRKSGNKKGYDLGLYIEVSPDGSKVFHCRRQRKSKVMVETIGPYPTISLSQARCSARLFNYDVWGDTLAGKVGTIRSVIDPA